MKSSQHNFWNFLQKTTIFRTIFSDNTQSLSLFNHYNGLFGAMAVVPKGNGEKFRNPRNLRDYYKDFEKSLAAKNEMIIKIRR